MTVTASSRPPVWPLAEQTIPNSLPAEIQQQIRVREKHRDQWSHRSLCRRTFIPCQRQCAPRAPQVQSGTKQVPCRVFLASEAALCPSRLAQRENWRGEKEGTSQMETGLCSQLPCSYESPSSQPLGGTSHQGQTWPMEISALKSNIIWKLMTNKIYFCSGLV